MDPRWSGPGPPGASRQTQSNIYAPNPDRLVRADETRAGSGKAGFPGIRPSFCPREIRSSLATRWWTRRRARNRRLPPCIFEPTQLRASADGNAAFVWKDIDSATCCCDMTNGQAHSSTHPRQASALVRVYDDLLIGVVGSGIVAFTPTSS